MTVRALYRDSESGGRYRAVGSLNYGSGGRFRRICVIQINQGKSVPPCAIASAASSCHAVVMKLHGSIIENLSAAVQSAKRLRGQPVYNETLQFWRDLLAQGRAEKRANPVEQGTIQHLVAKLQSELSERDAG